MAKSKWANNAAIAALVLGGLSLAACGGGGGGGSTAPAPTAVSPPPPPPPSSQGPTWTQGVFEPSSAFKDQCENPRTGVDAAGDPFLDQAGSLLEELFWLRSWTNETYLWNDEVTDQDPNGFNDRVDYFQVLKTFAVEPSGEDRDDFHFSQPTADVVAAQNSLGNPGYGAELVILRGAPPRDIRVGFNISNTPASRPISGQVPLPRGARILEINGQDVVNGFNTQAEIPALIELISPSSTGLSRDFRVQDDDGTIRTFTIVTEDIVDDPVLLTDVFNVGGNTVGYISFNTFNTFSAEEEIVRAMQQMQSANVDELVLDLRYNGGGFLFIAAQLGYMIAGPSQSAGKDFQRYIYNDDAGNTNPIDGTPNQPVPFVNQFLGFDDNASIAAGTALPALNLNRVFVLSTGDTCSASEAVINGLRGIDIEVVLIGGQTCGKPYGFLPQDNCGETYYTIQFQGANDKDFGGFSDGFFPANANASFGVSVTGCQVGDDFSKALGDQTEGLTAAALGYIQSATCPAVSTTTKTVFVASKTLAERMNDEALDQAFYLDNIMDLSTPK